MRSHAWEANVYSGSSGAQGELRFPDCPEASERATAILYAWELAIVELTEYCESRDIPKGRSYTKKGLGSEERDAIREAIRRAHGK